MIYADFGQPAMEEEGQPRGFQIRGHLVHGIPRVGDSNYDPACPTCNPGSINDTVTPTAVVVSSPPAIVTTAVAVPGPIPATNDYNYNGPLQHEIGPMAALRQNGGMLTRTDDTYSFSGFITGIAVVFVSGEMAGIGMLAAPWAVVNLGWLGFVLLITFGIATAYSACCLGTCWLILEERYAQYRIYPIPDPYPTIAMHAVGRRTSVVFSYATRACISITLFGSATVYLMLIAQTAQKLFLGSHPEVEFSTWLFVFSVSLSSLMFLESPKDYYIVATGAFLTTMTSSYFIIMQMLLDERIQEGSATDTQKSVPANQFFLSFGTILFAYGGAASFPVINFQMFKRDEFSHSVVASFILLTILFSSVVVGGYIIYGHTINPNIIMSLSDSWVSYAAVILMAGHLVLGFVIMAKPVTEQAESFLSSTNGFSVQRFFVRICVLLAMIFVGECMPNFISLVALIGCSTVILATFVLPSVFYLRLCAQQSATWPDRSLPWKSKLYMYTIIILGLSSGLGAMFTALSELFDLRSLIPHYYYYYFYDLDYPSLS
ncbi:amino acid transporter AVT1J isoform X1 [Acyrthosiphon pisum]|uniref:Amino acid transporter transmembrane domain-containing protein n=1 Tax=Acyrthosiphon pisum TaxID=7029 RepID=A0A8R2B9F0_ACYPI|nr:amino acid transporter AVT1J isoform X1 [Acyrthosiphon pisum]|eukprot:XP_008188121.1 PREDICTED: lysine histidine transporter 1 isoform X1 [Acyrthosiphon pisum]